VWRTYCAPPTWVNDTVYTEKVEMGLPPHDRRIEPIRPAETGILQTRPGGRLRMRVSTRISSGPPGRFAVPDLVTQKNRKEVRRQTHLAAGRTGTPCPRRGGRWAFQATRGHLSSALPEAFTPLSRPPANRVRYGSCKGKGAAPEAGVASGNRGTASTWQRGERSSC
jgi:hypothetical protein